MKPIIIACKTVEKELLSAMEEVRADYPVIWLDSGLHAVPKKLNSVLQEQLDLHCNDFDTVLLGLSLCGNAIIGLQSHDFQVVIPRTDDCISLMMDGQPRPTGTLFMTRGWLDGQQHMGREYDLCMERYGEKRGKRIFAALLKNYTHVAMLDTGCFDTASAESEIRAMGEKLGLEYTRLQGSNAWLKELVSGNWHNDRFILLPPNSVLTEKHVRP